MFCENTTNSLFVLRIHYISLTFSRIHYDFTISFANKLLIYDQFRKKNHDFTICFANSPWIDWLFRKFTMISLSFSFIKEGGFILNGSEPCAFLLWLKIIFARSKSLIFVFENLSKTQQIKWIRQWRNLAKTESLDRNWN